MRAIVVFFFFSSRRRHTRFDCDWSSDVCSSDLRPTKRVRLFGNPDCFHPVLLAELVDFEHLNTIHAALAIRWADSQGDRESPRSEEHTSELQSQSNLVCRLLLEKKKYHSTRRSL